MLKDLIFKLGFTLIGLGLLYGAWWVTQDASAFLEGAATAEGVVVDHSVSRSRKSTAYYPVVEFDAPSGERIRFVAASGSGSRDPAVGERVTLRYRPEDPGSARLAGFSDLWGASIVLALLGAVFAAVGIGMTVSGARARARAAAAAGPPPLPPREDRSASAEAAERFARQRRR